MKGRARVMPRKSGDPLGVRFKRGMTVVMNDGWCGRSNAMMAY
jgi:hypothetical protein